MHLRSLRSLHPCENIAFAPVVVPDVAKDALALLSSINTKVCHKIHPKTSVILNQPHANLHPTDAATIFAHSNPKYQSALGNLSNNLNAVVQEHKASHGSFRGKVNINVVFLH